MRHYNKPDDVTIWHYLWPVIKICLIAYLSVYMFLLQFGFVLEWMDDVRHQYRAVLLLAGFAGLFGLVFLRNKFRKV
jgi:hypothetical protein